MPAYVNEVINNIVAVRDDYTFYPDFEFGRKDVYVQIPKDQDPQEHANAFYDFLAPLPDTIEIPCRIRFIFSTKPGRFHWGPHKTINPTGNDLKVQFFPGEYVTLEQFNNMRR